MLCFSFFRKSFNSSFLQFVCLSFQLWKKKKSCLKRKRLHKQTEDEGKMRVKRKEEFRAKVDDIFLVVFPLLFLIFNLIYWPACLTVCLTVTYIELNFAIIFIYIF